MPLYITPLPQPLIEHHGAVRPCRVPSRREAREALDHLYLELEGEPIMNDLMPLIRVIEDYLETH